MVTIQVAFFFSISAFKLTTARDAPTGNWTAKAQLGGSTFVSQVVTKATTSQMNQTFALVLGLVGFLFLVGGIVVTGHEINVVLYRRLYPRALLTPFTDNVSLTEADRKAYTHYAKSQRHKGFQSIETRFGSPKSRRTKPPGEGT